MIEKDFQKIADMIFKDCESRYWYVPNNVKKSQIHVRSWHVPKQTAQFLHTLVVSTQSKQILELGTSAGYSTIWLAHATKKTNGHVDTIEYFEPKCSVAKDHFRQANVDEYITLHQNNILDIVSSWKKEIDFIFMDADRGNYDKYFPYLFPKLRVGGMIVVDNAGNYRDRMVRFLKQCDEISHQYSTFLDFDNGLFIFIK